jgi:MFS family permease
MYPSLRVPYRDGPDVGDSTGQPRWRRVSPNVFALGFTSMFTDVSSEMVNSIVPIYLTFQLGFTTFQLGLFIALYSGISAVTALMGATMADRLSRHKEVAGAGYTVSALCKLGLLASRSAWLPATGFLYLDRVGKGLRTAPRDALISLSSSRERLGESFGTHRALDTAGAVIGPVVAFTILFLAPGRFSSIFVVSFCIALFGVAILVLFVRNQKVKTAVASKRNRVVLRDAVHLLKRRSYSSIFVAGAALGLFTISDAFIYLTFQQRSNMNLAYFPLLYVGTSLVYLFLAVPLGRLADRLGRSFVFLGGFVFLAFVYVVLLRTDPGPSALIVMLVMFGTYYAATDGVLAAMTSSTLPEELRATGLAFLNGAVAVAGFFSALTFGALWSWIGPSATVRIFLIALVVTLVAAALLLVSAHARPDRDGDDAFVASELGAF